MESTTQLVHGKDVAWLVFFYLTKVVVNSDRSRQWKLPHLGPPMIPGQNLSLKILDRISSDSGFSGNDDDGGGQPPLLLVRALQRARVVRGLEGAVRGRLLHGQILYEGELAWRHQPWAR